MVPFAMALREVGSSKLKHFRGIAPEDLHNIQTHINSLDLLVCMCIRQKLSLKSPTSCFFFGQNIR